MSVHYDFTNIVRNDHFVVPVQVKNDGAAVDISGWKFWLTFKKSLDETDADAIAASRQYSVTMPNGSISGEVVLTLLVPADKTVTAYYYDIQYLTATGIRRTPFYGRIILVDERTYSAS